MSQLAAQSRGNICQEFETRMTASVLKQDHVQTHKRFKRTLVYYDTDTTQHLEGYVGQIVHSDYVKRYRNSNISSRPARA